MPPPSPFDAFPRPNIGGQIATLPPPSPPPPEGFFANVAQAFRGASTAAESDRGDTQDVESNRLQRGYAPIVDALGLPSTDNPGGFDDAPVMQAGFGGAAMLKRSSLAPGGPGNDMVTRSEQEALIAAEIARRRARDPNFLTGIPADVDGLHRLFAENEAKRLQQAHALAGSTQGVGGTLGGFAGSTFQLMHDPALILTSPAGGFGRNVAMRMLTEGAVFGGITASEQPNVVKNRAAVGQDYTATDALENIGSAAAGGALLRGGGELLHMGGNAMGGQLRSWFPDWARQRDADAFGQAMDRAVQMGQFSKDELPSVAARLMDPSFGVDSGGAALAQLRTELNAGTIDDRAIAAHFRLAVPDDMRTPDERAALAAIDRSADIDEANPYKPGPGGLVAHDENFAAALRRIVADAPGPSPAEPAPITAVPRVSTAPARAASPMSQGQIIRFVQNDLEGGARTVHYGAGDGGTTKFGIAAADNPGVDVANLSEDQAAEIARRKYWLPAFDQARPDVAPIAFDAYYIHGDRKFAERLAAMDDPGQALAAYRGLLNRIADTIPGKAKYRAGWMNRLDRLGRRIGADEPAFAAAEPRAPFAAGDEGVDVLDRETLAAEDVADEAADPQAAGAPDMESALRSRVADALAAERPVLLDAGGDARPIVEMTDAGLTDDRGVTIPTSALVDPEAPPSRLLIGPEPPAAIDVAAKAAPRRSGPVDLLQAIADHGGLRDDEGHDLVKGRGLPRYRLGAGTIIRKESGLSVDAMGEHLWEEGWFGPPATSARPSEDDVLRLVDRAAREKVYRPEDVNAVADRAAAAARMPAEDALFELAGHAREAGLHVDSATLDDALTHLARGETMESALGRAVENARFRDTAPPAGLERWDDADAEAFREALASLDHDARMDAEAADGAPLRAILDDLDREEAGAKALAACMAPGGAAA